MEVIINNSGDNKYKMFKAISGDMIIGKVVGESNESVSLETPLIVHFAPHPTGRLQIGLFPLNPFCETPTSSTTISKNHIMFCVDPIPQSIYDEFIRISSGIVIARTQEIQVPFAQKGN